MSTVMAITALEAAELAFKATCWTQSGELLMCATKLWRRGIVGRAMTPEFAREIDLFTARSCELRANLNTAQSAFGQLRGEA